MNARYLISLYFSWPQVYGLDVYNEKKKRKRAHSANKLTHKL